MKFNSLISKLVVAVIRFYQKIISPMLRNRCRFYPTCSEYAILAIKKYGLKVGSGKAYNRLLRCRPDNLDSCIDFP